MNTKAVGLIGVGLLGSALADRLVGAGIQLFGFDTSQAQMEALTQSGGVACDSAAGVIGRCDVVVFSLPSSEVVHALVHQHLSSFKSNQIILDTTTGDPEQMIAVGESLAELSVYYLEATVAGSSAQVRTGHVALFLGGDSQVIERTQPILSALTSRYFHLGPLGSASRFKLVHNLILGLNRAVLAEGLAFAESLGFDSSETLEILKQTPAESRVMEMKGSRMVDREYQLQARLTQHLKDVRLILAEAERAGAHTPLSKTHQTLLEQAEQLGYGDADNSAVIEAFRQTNRKADS